MNFIVLICTINYPHPPLIPQVDENGNWKTSTSILKAVKVGQLLDKPCYSSSLRKKDTGARSILILQITLAARVAYVGWVRVRVSQVGGLGWGEIWDYVVE